tara:strand:- start:81 stop:788 length:708 start_codon:yes stop_codon:yes gene_type:complete
MKITKSQLIQLIKEETQGEMEFAELERARQNYKENPRDDEARYQFGLMVEKLVEPLMIDMGLFFEAEAFYNRGELVFTNKRVEVTVDPLGMMGRYDVMVTPQYGAEDDIRPVDISLDTMKGVAQFVNDKVFSSTGMVGEPEAQTELPLEHKMRVTKSQLQQVIREAIEEEMEDRISGKDMLAMYDAEQGLDAMSAEEAMEELDNILTDIRQTSTDARSAKQAYRAEDMLRVITRR